MVMKAGNTALLHHSDPQMRTQFPTATWSSTTNTKTFNNSNTVLKET